MTNCSQILSTKRTDLSSKLPTSSHPSLTAELISSEVTVAIFATWVAILLVFTL